MFEYDDKTKKYEFCHNPFSLPHNGIKEYEKENITHRVNISSYSLHYSSSPTKVTTDFAGTTISLVFIAVPFPKLDVSEVV